MLERTKDIHIWATPEELEKIMKRDSNGSVGLKEILRLLQISGNNLNQYAKKANETVSIYHEDIEELKNNQKEILQEMRKVLDRLTAIM